MEKRFLFSPLTPFLLQVTTKLNEDAMGYIAWLSCRCVDQQKRRMDIVWWMGIIFLMFLTGCKQEMPAPKEDGAMPRKDVPKFFLVTPHDGDISNIAIYEIDDPDEVEKIDDWTRLHVDRDSNPHTARGLVLLWWHEELLRFNEHGKLVSSDDLAGRHVIRGVDLMTLREMFRKHGKRVDTVPGRKPPKKPEQPHQQAWIENEGT